MIKAYTYEVRKGEKKIGEVTFAFKLYGDHIVVPEDSEFKRSYYKKTKVNKFLVKTALEWDNGIDFMYRRYIDVSRKSKRQIKLLLQQGPFGLL